MNDKSSVDAGADYLSVDRRTASARVDDGGDGSA